MAIIVNLTSAAFSGEQARRAERTFGMRAVSAIGGAIIAGWK